MEKSKKDHDAPKKCVDQNFLAAEAQLLAKIFNEKMQNLNPNDRLFFMDSFNKSITLSTQLHQDCESAKNDPNSVPSPEKMQTSNVDKVAGDFELLSLDDLLKTKNNSFTANFTIQKNLVSGEKEISHNTETLASESPTSKAINEPKRTKKSNKSIEKVNYSAIVKQQMSDNAPIKDDSQNSMKKFETSNTADTIKTCIQKTDTPTLSQNATLKTTDIPKTDNIILQNRSWRDNPTQTHVANVSQHSNKWMQNKVPQKLRQTKFEKSNKKSLNILILGESGVGKSTWINAFANYLIYNTLEDAIAAEAPICVIPTQFTLFDDNNEQHEVILGDQNNEVFSEGRSATQEAKTYFFEHEKYDIYLIDTPGMNDTRGKEQDDKNIQSILRAIAPFKELHGICFLFKPKETRLKRSFTYTLSQLLNNLSRSSLENICIIFTHASGTFYRPGETLGLLETYFKELKEKSNLAVKMNDENVFCLDNEAFRFCCAYFGRIKFEQSEIDDLSDSWRRSKDEISRFLKYAARLRPQSTTDVLSINETRTWILQLVSPAIKVSDIIQTNLEKLQKRIIELESMKNNIKELQKRTAVPITSLKIIQLQHPQTVCASQKCVKYEKVMDNIEVIYKTVCHKNCYIKDGDPTKIPDPALKQCEAFLYNNNKCYHCGCNILDHIRIFYEQRIETNFVETVKLKNALMNQKDASELKAKMIQSSAQMIDDYRQELNFIMFAMAQFYLFLSTNGVGHNVDIFEKHIQNLIDFEVKMSKASQHYDDQKYLRLADFLLHYRNVRSKVLKENANLSLTDIQDIRQKLFTMPYTGSKIAEIFDIHVEVDENDYAENITRCDKQSVIEKSTSWFQKIKNTFSFW